MPLPFILGAAALVAGAVGIYKSAKSVSNNNEARELNEKAVRVFDVAKYRLESQKRDTTESLDNLGQIKVQSWNYTMGKFINLVSTVKIIDNNTSLVTEDGSQVFFTDRELQQIKRSSVEATAIESKGFQALGAGALAGAATYGVTLAAGGLGLAGGAALIGGVFAAPALAVGGFLLEAKSRENLAEAKSNLSKARAAAEELDTLSSKLRAIEQIANQFSFAINELGDRMTEVLDVLEQHLIQAHKIQSKRVGYKIRKVLLAVLGKQPKLKYAQLTQEQCHYLHISYLFAQTMKMLLVTPLLDHNGHLDHSCSDVIEKSEELLESYNS